MKFIIFFIILSCLLTCSNKSDIQNPNLSVLIKNESKNSKSIDIMIGDSILAKIGVDGNGNLRHLVNYPQGNTQILNFYEKTGFLKAKVMRNINNVADGISYSFYEDDESLQGVFFYEEGVLKGDAYTYYQYNHSIENILHYNENGEIDYRKRLDEYGYPIAEK